MDKFVIRKRSLDVASSSSVEQRVAQTNLSSVSVKRLQSSPKQVADDDLEAPIRILKQVRLQFPPLISAGANGDSSSVGVSQARGTSSLISLQRNITAHPRVINAHGYAGSIPSHGTVPSVMPRHGTTAILPLKQISLPHDNSTVSENWRPHDSFARVLWRRLLQSSICGNVSSSDVRQMQRIALGNLGPVPLQLVGSDGVGMVRTDALHGGVVSSRSRITSLTLDASGELLLASSADKRMRLWNCDSIAATGLLLRNAATQHSTTRITGVPTVCAQQDFLVPGAAVDVAWNPIRHDDIVVATSGGADLFVYDLSRDQPVPLTLTRVGDSFPSAFAGAGGSFSAGNTVVLYLCNAAHVSPVASTSIASSHHSASALRGRIGMLSATSSASGKIRHHVEIDDVEEDECLAGAIPFNVEQDTALGDMSCAHSGVLDCAGAGSSSYCILAGDGTGRVRLWDCRVKNALKWTVDVADAVNCGRSSPASAVLGGSCGGGLVFDYAVCELSISPTETGVIGAVTSCGVVAHWDLRRLVRGTLASRTTPSALRTFNVISMAETAAASALRSTASSSSVTSASSRKSYVSASAAMPALQGAWPLPRTAVSRAATPIVQHALRDPIVHTRSHFVLSNGWILSVDIGYNTASSAGTGDYVRQLGGGGESSSAPFAAVRRILPAESAATATQTTASGPFTNNDHVVVPPRAACFVMLPPPLPRRSCSASTFQGIGMDTTTKSDVTAPSYPHPLLFIAQSRAYDPVTLADSASVGQGGRRHDTPDDVLVSGISSTMRSIPRVPCIAAVDVWRTPHPRHYDLFDTGCLQRVIGPPELLAGRGADVTAVVSHSTAAGIVFAGYSNGNITMLRPNF